jgi:putative hydrolase of the HAD superfamily
LAVRASSWYGSRVRRRPLRFVLFDVGNTLLHLDYAFLADVLARHGHTTTPDAIRFAEYGAKAALDRHLLPHHVPAGTVETRRWPDGAPPAAAYFDALLGGVGVPPEARAPLLRTLHASHRAENLWRVLEPDTPAVLAALRARGFTLAAVSNADGRVEADLGRAGLASHLAIVVDSHVVGVEKPDPAIFALALERLGASPAAALYVGDIFAIDVVGARRAGLDAILMDPLDRYPGPVDCPRIARLADLLALLPPSA